MQRAMEEQKKNQLGQELLSCTAAYILNEMKEEKNLQKQGGTWFNEPVPEMEDLDVDGVLD